MGGDTASTDSLAFLSPESYVLPLTLQQVLGGRGAPSTTDFWAEVSSEERLSLRPRGPWHLIHHRADSQQCASTSQAGSAAQTPGRDQARRPLAVSGPPCRLGEHEGDGAAHGQEAAA